VEDSVHEIGVTKIGILEARSAHVPVAQPRAGQVAVREIGTLAPTKSRRDPQLVAVEHLFNARIVATSFSHVPCASEARGRLTTLREGHSAFCRVPLQAVVGVRHEVARVFVKEQYRRPGVLPPVLSRE
jgi:hypothetical protein